MYIKLHPQCTYNYINNVHIPTYIKLRPQCTYNYIYNVHITTSTIIYKTNIDNVNKTNINKCHIKNFKYAKKSTF